MAQNRKCFSDRSQRFPVFGILNKKKWKIKQQYNIEWKTKGEINDGINERAYK